MHLIRKLSIFVGAALLAAAALSRAGAEDIRIESAVVTPIEHVELPALAAGQLVKVAVADGTVVRKGDLIAEIDQTEAQLAAHKAQAALAIAKAEAVNDNRALATAKAAEVAKAELKRAVEAGEKYSKSISQTELDRLRLSAEQHGLEHQEAIHDLEIARLNVEVKVIEVEMARRALERHILRSPIDGIVVEIKRRPGEWVEPGMTVTRIISMDPLRVEGFLDTRRLSRARVGMPVKFVPAFDDPKPTVYVGKLSFVSPEANPVNGQVRVAAMFENGGRVLQPGLHGELTIIVSEEK